jgi:hypothetical protein
LVLDGAVRGDKLEYRETLPLFLCLFELSLRQAGFMGDRSTHSDNPAGRKLKRIWQGIAEQLRQEKQDPEKMVKLWRELDRGRARIETDPDSYKN